ncbi:hypothetical protein [Streptomyces sp. 3214.6]|uniref:hypothetical protein n=1 Tax=Streptomyces sp. 3214.6 TaxID=1882757 RepID=UPI00090BDCD7|nr:hypothetical protein [Streptomyces sp. 3214.6]SHI22370.1 hypothetical protein SAMN05444521_5656 [Streptomyces sp. 3214.6]
MRHRIARLFEPLLRLLLPGTGRRRRAVTATAPLCACPTCSCAEDNAMVRPYLVAHERHGIGPRGIHGVEVTA